MSNNNNNNKNNNEKQSQLLQTVDWLLGNKCEYDFDRRVEDLKGAIKQLVPLIRTIVPDGGEKLRELIFPCICKLTMALRHPGVPAAQVVVLEDLVHDLLNMFKAMLVLYFPEKWQALIPQIGSTMLKNTAELTRVEACIRTLLVVFKTTEYRAQDGTGGRIRNQLVQVIHPELLPILIKLVAKRPSTQQEMTIVRCILRIFIASNRIKLSTYHEDWEKLEPWLKCADRLIARPPVIPDIPADSTVKKCPMGARVVARAIDCFNTMLRYPKSVPVDKKEGCYKPFVQNVIMFLQANVGRAATLAPYRSALCTFSQRQRQFRAVLEPNVPLMLTKCLYPALKLQAGQHSADDVDWDEDYFDTSLQSLRPMVDALISEWTTAYPTVQKPFVRFLLQAFKQCATRLDANPDDVDAGLTMEASFRAFSRCASFLQRGTTFRSTLKDCFDNYFLPALQKGAPLVQAAAVRLCSQFIELFHSSELPRTFLSTLLFQLKGEAPSRSLQSSCIGLVCLLVNHRSCQTLIENSFDSIAKTAVGMLDPPGHVKSAEALGALVNSPRFAAKLLPYTPDIINAVFPALRAITDDDCDIIMFIEELLRVVAGLVTEYHTAENVDMPPKWTGALRRVLKALAPDEMIDFREVALINFDWLLRLEPPTAETAELFMQYLKSTPEDYIVECGNVFRNYFAFETDPDRRSAALEVFLGKMKREITYNGLNSNALFLLSWALSKNVHDSPALQQCLPELFDGLCNMKRQSSATCALIAALLSSPCARSFLKYVDDKWSRESLLESWLDSHSLRTGSRILIQKVLGSLAVCIELFSADAKSLSTVKSAGHRLIERLEDLRNGNDEQFDEHEEGEEDDDNEDNEVDDDLEDNFDQEDEDDPNNEDENGDEQQFADLLELEDVDGDLGIDEDEPWSEADEEFDGEQLFVQAAGSCKEEE